MIMFLPGINLNYGVINMADDCTVNVDLIYPDENIGDSLEKINNNFTKLKQAVCEVEGTLDRIVNIRTFFYYGPNSVSNQENTSSRPNDSTIEAFVNNSDKLDLAREPISETGDMAYVIYQKTGWYSKQDTYYKSGTGSLPFQRTVRVAVTRKIGIGGKGGGGTVTTYEPRVETYYVGYRWETNVSDTYKIYAPTLVIYRLTYNGTQYLMDSGFPKFTQASTSSTTNWNNPQLWTTY